MIPISLIVTDADESARSETLATLKSLGAKVNIAAATVDLRLAMKIIPDANPHVVMLQIDDIDQGVHDVSHLAASYPNISVIVTADDKNPDWILRLIRAGAEEYLTRPVARPELADAFQKLAKNYAHRHGMNKAKGSIISVFNPTGGMGTTTIAVNTAAFLASQGKEVVLVDLNTLNGDSSAFLDITPKYTLSDVIAKKGYLDGSFLKSVVASHGGGLKVLSGPAYLTDAYKLSAGLMHELLGVLQANYAYVVVDTGGPISDYNLATFGYSDMVLFTTELTFPALKNCKRYLAALRDERVESGRLNVVINRHQSKSAIKVAEAESILGRKAYALIPNGYGDVINAINRGQPLCACAPRSPVTHAIGQLADRLVSDLGQATSTAMRGSLHAVR